MKKLVLLLSLLMTGIVSFCAEEPKASLLCVNEERVQQYHRTILEQIGKKQTARKVVGACAVVASVAVAAVLYQKYLAVSLDGLPNRPIADSEVALSRNENDAPATKKDFAELKEIFERLPKGDSLSNSNVENSNSSWLSPKAWGKWFLNKTGEVGSQIVVFGGVGLGMELVKNVANGGVSVFEKAIGSLSNNDILQNANSHYMKSLEVLGDIEGDLSFRIKSDIDIQQDTCYSDRMRLEIERFVYHVENLLAYIQFISEESPLLKNIYSFILTSSNNVCIELEACLIDNEKSLTSSLSSIRFARSLLERDKYLIFGQE